MIYVFRYALIVLYTVLWGSAACVAAAIDQSGRSVVWIARTWIRWILATCGVRVEVEGLENVPRSPAIFMSNHQSVFDTAAIIATLPVQWRFVAKKELTWIPIFGWALLLHGHIIVDRSDRERAIRSLERGAEKIRAGTNVIVFPEGTRSDTGAIRPFKSGGFHLAIRAGAPIVPVSVSGSQRVTPKRSLRIESGRIRIVYGKPIPTSRLGVEDRNALKGEVREAILRGLTREV